MSALARRAKVLAVGATGWRGGQETTVPLPHLKASGFEFDVVTPTGAPAIYGRTSSDCCLITKSMASSSNVSPPTVAVHGP